MSYIFYMMGPEDKVKLNNNIDQEYVAYLWYPKLTQAVPLGISLLPFAVWSLFHWLRIFRNRSYCVFVIYHNNKLIHRSIVSPGYFRFPFMTSDDLQIGDTWTDNAYRNQGLASYAIQEIVRITARPNRKFWYLVEGENIPSIRAVEKVGFGRVGVGIRSSRFGLKLFGAFELQPK